MSDVRQINGKYGRWYETPAGNFPSVTTILSATKPERDRQSLKQWRDKVGEAEASRISKQSTSDGTLLHSCIEGVLAFDDRFNDIRGTFELIANDTTGADKERVSRLFIGWDEHIRNRTGAVYALEQFGWNERHGYAGAIDYYGEFDGVPSVVDWKNSSKAKRDDWITDYKLQGSAYIGIASRCPAFTMHPPPQQFVCVVMHDEAPEPQVFKYDLRTILSDIWPLWEQRCKLYHKMNAV